MTTLVIAVCCREWPVDPLSPIGRCGFCGERPVIDWTINVSNPEQFGPRFEYDAGGSYGAPR